MKSKILKTVVPTLLGILSIIGVIELQEVIHNHYEPNADSGHVGNELLYILFIPLGLIALFFQSSIVLPIWNKSKKGSRVFRMTIFQLAVLFCLISGLSFGLLFWTPVFGISDLLLGALIGIMVAAFLLGNQPVHR